MVLTMLIVLILIVAGLGVIAWQSFSEADRPRATDRDRDSIRDRMADLKPVQSMREVAAEASEELAPHRDNSRNEASELNRREKRHEDFRAEASEELLAARISTEQLESVRNRHQSAHEIFGIEASEELHPVSARDEHARTRQQERHDYSDFHMEAAQELHPVVITKQELHPVVISKQDFASQPFAADTKTEASEELQPNPQADRFANPASLSFSERLELEKRIEQLSIKPPMFVEQLYTEDDIRHLEEQLERNSIRPPRIFEITSITTSAEPAAGVQQAAGLPGSGVTAAAAAVQSLGTKLHQMSLGEQQMQTAVMQDLLMMFHSTASTLTEIQQQVTLLTLLNEISAQIPAVYAAGQQQSSL